MPLSDRQMLDSLSRMPLVDTAELAGVFGEAHATARLALVSRRCSLYDPLQAIAEYDYTRRPEAALILTPSVWEQRAVHPSTMAARLAPYLRYSSSNRPPDDHGERPLALIVFEDYPAEANFLGVARREEARIEVEVPL